MGTQCELHVEDLTQVPILRDLPAEQLAWLRDHGELLQLEEGEALWMAGEPADAMFVVVSGSVQLLFDIAGQSLRITSDRYGGVTGLLPYSRMTEFQGRTTAVECTRVLSIHRDNFPAMLRAIPELGFRLVAIMADRIREGTRVQQQREKMLALGKLAAGLAHEINNPAAAVRRTLADLERRHRELGQASGEMLAAGVEREQLQMAETLALGSQAADLSALERGRREDDLADWLEDQEVDESWVLSEALVEAGLDRAKLESAVAGLPASAIKPLLTWIEIRAASSQLLAQAAEASQRIAELVASVKTYSHLDRAPEAESVDLHRGLDSTLTMLGHRIREQGAQVIKNYSNAIDSVPGVPGDLNQVWTNLIDNALDVLTSDGILTITTVAEADQVLVSFNDNGPGIPEETRERVFEAFFTTKAPGEGTGLGLDIVRRLVDQHRGEVTVSSEPGDTTFTVRLPTSPP